MARHVAYHFHIHAPRPGRRSVRWVVTRTRWEGVGTAALSAVVAEGTLGDLAVPAGSALEQAALLSSELHAALLVMLADASGEIDAAP